MSSYEVFPDIAEPIVPLLYNIYVNREFVGAMKMSHADKVSEDLSSFLHTQGLFDFDHIVEDDSYEITLDIEDIQGARDMLMLYLRG